MPNELDLEERLLARLDRQGQLAQVLRTYDNPTGRLFLRALGLLAKGKSDRLVNVLDDAQHLLRDTKDTVLLFAPLGWAPTSRSDIGIYRNALAVYHKTGSSEEAERVLIEGWNTDDRLRNAVLPIQVLGMGDDDLRQVADRRWWYVQRALAHHQAGAYEASVLIVYAQIDGLIRDIGKFSFFDGGSKEGEKFLDERTLLGLPESLEPLRALFGATVKRSDSTGSLSRHAVLHGRELGYDTIENSTKSFVLLSAVIDWALPRAQERVENAQREREQRYAGSKEVDESGRRLDRRGFAESKSVLLALAGWQHQEWSERTAYSDDLGRFRGSIWNRSNPKETDLQVRVTQDGNAYWSWSQTPSGYCLGEAHGNGLPGGWHFAGDHVPHGGPGVDDGWRDILRDPALPDW